MAKRKKSNPTPAAFLAQHSACAAGAAFAMQYQTMADVWDACQRPDWLLWILDRLDMPLDQDRRLFAVWCAVCTPMADGRTTRALLTDPRSLDAVRVATRYALGCATEAELTAAWAVAGDAARAAARAAAWAVAGAAAWAVAGDAARAAAWAVAGDAAGDAARAAQCHHLRTLVPNPFR